MNRRRRLLVALGAGPFVGSLPILAQDRRPRKIGFLGGASAEIDAPMLAEFRKGMAALGWVDGRDYVIEARHAAGVPQRLTGLAAELVATQPDIFLTPSDATARALTERSTIPVVFANARDPIGSGLAKSLQRPAGTSTGVVGLSVELSAKRLELLKQVSPNVSHVVVLFDAEDKSGAVQVREIERAGAALGIRITAIGVRQPSDIALAFSQGASLGTNAYLVTDGAPIFNQRKTIVEFVARDRAAAVYANDEFAIVGGLLSYGSQITDNFRRAAEYVDKILKGAKPGDLPIEQPTKFEPVINLKTAKALGLAIPQSLLVRADKVIQ